MIWPIEIHSEGKGQIQYTRHSASSGDPEIDDLYANTVDFKAVPELHYHFVKFEIRGNLTFLSDNGNYIRTRADDRIILEKENIEKGEIQFTVTLDQPIVVYAYFEEDPKYHVDATADIPHATISVGINDQYEPFTTTLWARPYPNYNFYMWSDGLIGNPREIYVDKERVSVVALYKPNTETNGLYEYRCFIKDQSSMTDLPKAFLRIDKFDTSNDLMTRANSTVFVYDAPDSIESGDVLVLYDPKGTSIYNGVIKSIETENEHEKKIICSQMQSFYKGQWVYEKGESPPASFNNSWFFEKFAAVGSEFPHIDDVDALPVTSSTTYNDNSISTKLNAGDNFTARATTYVWCSKPTKGNVSFITIQNGAVYLNGQQLAELTSGQESMCEVQFVKGMNKLVVLYRNDTGDDGFNAYLNYESYPSYDSTKKYAVGDYVGYSNVLYRCKTAITTPEKWTDSHWTAVSNADRMKLRISNLPNVLGINSTAATDLYLEKCIDNIVKYYSDGYIVGSDYRDPKVAQRLSGITSRYIGSTLVNLPTNPVGETMDFEDFIYYLYEHYGIIFEFEINVSGPNYVTIRIPDYDPVKVGDNIFSITKMNPVTTSEETNRLIIFASDNVTYRATWVATETGVYEATVEEATRMKTTNTEIVFSDDPISDIVASNLPNQMFNHHISFTLLLKNFVYDFDEFKLGGPLQIYTINDYYDSVLTGYEISKDSNTNISEVDFICGKVRQKLTQLLTLKKI